VRIVIDTNIWVSGLLWRGAPWRLLRLAEEGQIELCVSPGALVELVEVLSHERLQPRLRELQLSSADVIVYVAHRASFFEVSEGAPIVAADPDDDVFLRCAEAAHAAYVVSGDRHLLNVGTYAGIPIVTVRDFLTKEFADLEV
jgi:hypothetical protein